MFRNHLITFGALIAAFAVAGCGGGGTTGSIPAAPAHVQIPTATSVSPATIAAPPMARTAVQSGEAMSAARMPQNDIQNPNFTQMPGAGVWVAASPDGTFWVLSTAGLPSGDKFIYHYVNGTYINVQGAATRLAVGPDNTVWAVNAAGGIYFLRNGAFTGIAGGASEISVGADGAVYVISNQGPSGPFGRGIYRYLNGSWTQLPGAGVTIAASLDSGSYPALNISPGGFYVTNAAGGIYYYNPATGFTQLPGGAIRLAPNTTGGLFALGDPAAPLHGIYFNNLSTGQWRQVPGAANTISANTDSVYVTSAAGGIYRSAMTPVATPTPTPTATPTPVPTPTPTPTPAPGAVGASPSSFAFTATGQTGSFAATQANSTGVFSATSSNTNVVTVTTSDRHTFTVTATGAGSASIVVTGTNNQQTSVGVTVTTTGFTVN